MTLCGRQWLISSDFILFNDPILINDPFFLDFLLLNDPILINGRPKKTVPANHPTDTKNRNEYTTSRTPCKYLGFATLRSADMFDEM